MESTQRHWSTLRRSRRLAKKPKLSSTYSILLNSVVQNLSASISIRPCRASETMPTMVGRPERLALALAILTTKTGLQSPTRALSWLRSPSQEVNHARISKRVLSEINNKQQMTHLFIVSLSSQIIITTWCSERAKKTLLDLRIIMEMISRLIKAKSLLILKILARVTFTKYQNKVT